MTAEANWLESLKAGDEVCVKTSHSATIHKVKKVTPTQIVLTHLRFRRKDGLRIGDSWISQWLSPATDKVRLDVEKRELVNRLASLDRHKLNELPIETLRQANELLKVKDTP